MRVLTWNLALGTWLIVSCFALAQTPQSIILGYAAAVIVLSASIAVFSKPSARYVVTATALLLALFSLVLPDISLAARVSNVITGAALFALSLLSPTTARWEGEEEPPITPPAHLRAAPHSHGVHPG